MKSGPRVDPTRAVGHHVRRVFAPARLARVLDAHQGLLRTVHRCASPVHRGSWTLHRIDTGVLVADHHAVGDAARRDVEPNLPVDGIRAEESQVHARVSGVLGGVEHRLRPVLVVPDGKERPAVQQRAAIEVRIDIGRVGDVVAGSLGPADEVDIPVEELRGAVVGVGPIKGHFHSPHRTRHSVGPITVVLVETLARPVVIGIVVIGLVGRHRLLIEKGGRPAVPDHEDDVVLIARRIGEQRQVDAARPVAGDGQGITGRPVTGDQPGGRIGRTGGLRDPGKRAGVESEATAEAAVPAHPINVDGVGLRGIDGDIQGEAAALGDAGGGGIALDLLGRIVGNQ